MREFNYASVLDDYDLVTSGVRQLGDEHFQFLTESERETVRGEILGEIRLDFAFKLMTLLEADIRSDYRITLDRRKRDNVSRAYRDLCQQYRRETRQTSKPAKSVCSRMSLDRILDSLRDAFVGVDEDLRRVCSVIKGYFAFRNWYAHGRASAIPQAPDPEDVFAAYQELVGKVLQRW